MCLFPQNCLKQRLDEVVEDAGDEAGDDLMGKIETRSNVKFLEVRESALCAFVGG